MHEEVSPAEVLAGVIESTAKVTGTIVVKQCLIRCPVHILAKVDAMAAHSGKSRNFMIAQLLSLGVDAVTQELEPETRAALVARERDITAAFLGEDVDQSTMD